MPDTFLLAGEGALWLQPDGPNTEPKYLGCHMLGDVTVPKGDLTLKYCPDPSGPNKFKVSGAWQTAPGPVTTVLTTDIQKTKDELENVKCPAPLYIHQVTCGRMDGYYNYDRTYILPSSYITQLTLSNMAVKDPGDQTPSQQAYAISATEMEKAFSLTAVRLTIAETENILSITSCDEDSCAGDCGDASDKGDNLFVGTGVLAGSPVNEADMWYSNTAGSAWTLGLFDPFAAAEVIGAIGCFELDSTTTRLIVARGTTDAGNPMEIGYSDDNGTTYTMVDVGSTDGQYAPGPRALQVMNYYNMWVVTTGGYVYFSSDGGGTWSALYSGSPVSDDLYAVDFANVDDGYAVGENNAIIKTTDGGATWNTITGPTGQAAVTINTLRTHSKNRVWIGFADGTLWYTHDGGTTWIQRGGWSGSGTGAITDMDWYDILVGAFLHTNSDTEGELFITINGGYSWKEISLPTTAVLNSIVVIDPALLYAVGNAEGGTGVILKVTGG